MEELLQAKKYICKPITGLNTTCKPIAGFILKPVNLF
jgi:hypothetical protein